ncbi:uncharacterized protein LOC110906426 [Helianthus annuus]|uniref:uncharacterized protein LOC110906426 n=1 Tax=Helianthus annuus TaxID=4232 RepID=UPI000B8F986C|nr:uncharacterized protein LOC110906426 [Helianthus annuus]
MVSPIHSVVTVSNIKNFIPVTLDIESGHYTSWSELFKIRCKVFQVCDHLKFKLISATSSSDKDEATVPTESWQRLDSIVLLWIYRTISTDLLHTILKPDITAFDAWPALANLSQDNKATRKVDLNNKVATTRPDQFPSMSAYCQAMKVIVDQLTNVGSLINDKQLVLQLLTGMIMQYEGIAMIIQQSKPLPSKERCSSRWNRINYYY